MGQSSVLVTFNPGCVMDVMVEISHQTAAARPGTPDAALSQAVNLIRQNFTVSKKAYLVTRVRC